MAAHPAAAAILALAREKADVVRRDATVEAAALRESARQEGYAAGLLAGRTEARRELQARVVDVEERCNQEITAHLAHLCADLEDALVEASTVIGEVLAQQTLSAHPERVRSLVEQALRLLLPPVNLRVRVAPDAATALAGVGDGVEVSLVVDEHLDGVDFVAESADGRIDGRMASRLAAIRAQLRDA